MSDIVDNAASICRSAAEQMVALNIQWRLDPQYIIRLCDEVEALRAERDAIRKATIEECAKWHDEQAAELEAEMRRYAKGIGWADSGRAAAISRHRSYAAAIRSLASPKTKEGDK